MDPMVLKALLDQARDEALEQAAQIADEHAARGAAHWAGRAIRALKTQPAGCGLTQHPGSNPGSPHQPGLGTGIKKPSPSGH
ncbi:MAG: hypothetical protein IRZ13_19695 [Acetobacteraceae bacterium]|nr:hypothetical protein [Acetobacteraceae bacterium]